MAKFELVMPRMGESIIEATILKWVKEIGDDIEQEETVLEIATDKVDSEVPSPVDGKLLEMRYSEGDVVAVGEVVAIIGTEEEVKVQAENPTPVKDEDVLVAEGVPYLPSSAGAEQSVSDSPRFYSPLVLNIARKEGISVKVLDNIAGTGRGGRVTKKDILAFVEKRGVEADSVPQSNGHHTNPSAKTKAPAKDKPMKTVVEKKFSHSGDIEVVEMDRMRKLIAENMVYSKAISAHVTSFVEADVTNLVRWRNRVKNDFQQKYGEKLTFTPMFVHALVKAITRHPKINASVEGDKILYKKDINIGVAVALPNDNLIVPVIKQADRLNLVGLSSAVNDLARRARDNKLKPSELEGGTYTISNVGTFGNVMGTPIIMQPQVAIMAVGAIRKLPSVLETEAGDVIAIRQKMFLSHSYDHRVIDGSLGGRFVRSVADFLENWDTKMDI